MGRQSRTDSILPGFGSFSSGKTSPIFLEKVIDIVGEIEPAFLKVMMDPQQKRTTRHTSTHPQGKRLKEGPASPPHGPHTKTYDLSAQLSRISSVPNPGP